MVDLRFGVKWLVMPQLALSWKVTACPGDGLHMECATFKAAFGF